MFSRNDKRPPIAATAVFAATTLLGSLLLFQVQPMVGKRILPWFGGGPAVWTTAMLFFQCALLAGYAYAHGSVRLLRPRRQAIVHAGLLVAVAALLLASPVVASDAWQPTDGGSPALRVMSVLAGWVGVPFLTLAATAPLVQSWFGRACPGRSPYPLYALSNLGSLAGLLAYPLVIEPRWGLAQQGAGWTAGFWAYGVLCLAAAWLGARSTGEQSLAGKSPAETGRLPATRGETPPLVAVVDGDELTSGVATTLRSPALTWFFWIALPACASALLLATTNLLCQDLASLPLLWIGPLAIYLLSFIACFESDRWYRRWAFFPATGILSAAVAHALAEGARFSLAGQLAIYLSFFGCAAMICHGELAAMRPAVGRLTSFYLAIAAGGAVGGGLVSLAAPAVLKDYYEFPLTIVALWLLALTVLVTDQRSSFYDGGRFAWLAAMCAAIVALAVAMFSDIAGQRTSLVASSRNFYGVLKVRLLRDSATGSPLYSLVNGRIVHGAQFRDGSNERVPTQYYHPQSGVGLILGGERTGPRQVGVVGLGAGTLAAYAGEGDRYVFFEINPQVPPLAEEHFTFLSDARQRGAAISIVPGDARLALARGDKFAFDVLVLDAFSGDAIPTHLLTREAMELYLQHLAPTGILAVHVSNLHMELEGVVRGAAEALALHATVTITGPEAGPGCEQCTWILLSRTAGEFEKRNIGVAWRHLEPEPRPILWTDDFSSVWQILR